MTAGGFGRELTLGVEEELYLVDAGTLDTAPGFSLLVPDPGPRVKAELFECLVEITTPVCRTAGEVLRELRRLRLDIADRAEAHGLAFLAAGTHPLARGDDQPLVPEPRYRELAETLGDRVFRQLVCGLHVHVGVASADASLRATEGILPWLPIVLSLSANSPFAEGEDTGLRSARAARIAELPSGGAPPFLRDWRDWEEAAGEDYTTRHWDARPHPRLGTVEVRIADQQTAVDRSAGFAALVQALVGAVSDREPEPYDRVLYAERRARAAAEPPDPGDIARLAVLVEPVAERLGTRALVHALLRAHPEAERQLAFGLDGLPRELVERSLA